MADNKTDKEDMPFVSSRTISDDPDVLRSRVATLEMQVQRFERVNAVLRSENEILRQQLDHANRGSDELKAHINHLFGEVHNASASFRTELAQVTHYNHELQKQVKAHEMSLLRLKSSTSWVIISPLRGVLSLFRKGQDTETTSKKKVEAVEKISLEPKLYNVLDAKLSAADAWQRVLSA